MAAPGEINELRHRYAAQPRRYLAPLANALRQTGALEEAVTMLRAQLAEYPDHLTGHVVLGQALFDTGALAESRAAFERARALDPGNRVVLRHLGDIASLAGDAPGARVWFGRLRAAEPYADDVAAQLGGSGELPPAYDIEADDTAVAVEASDEVAEPAPTPEPPAAAEPVGRAAAPEAFELLDFGSASELDLAELDLAELDPVVGLDLPPAAPPPVLRAEHGDSEAGPLEHVVDGPFATETMAGLLAVQGHTEQAVAIYERLAADRPDDAALRARLAALRGEPALDHPPEHVPEVLSPPARAPDDDATRGALLTAAFADLPRRDASPAVDAGPEPIAASDDTPAALVDDTDPFADVSFDRFFPATVAPDDAPADDADLARFDAWLRRGAA